MYTIVDTDEVMTGKKRGFQWTVLKVIIKEVIFEEGGGKR
jgi:hypothetical protein